LSAYNLKKEAFKPLFFVIWKSMSA
jgi:hypothetical protein